ncbi:CSS-motif domain-containing protein, partial [Salmonella enterica subsp. enterica serovar Infantis]
HWTRRKVFIFLGTFIVVLLTLLLAIWFGHIRAVSETRNQLLSFAQLVLDKTERVIMQADLARDAAEQYKGQACTPAHQQ